ncbi:MAG: hypothetical protein ABIH39_06755, partial [Candidatus Margulisiibacteriota bacterium]
QELLQIIAPDAYSATMISDEAFEAAHTLQMQGVYILDAGGSARNFNPSGSFATGFQAKVINVGDENIVFDSTETESVILPGEIATFIYTGATWFRENGI